MPHPTRRDLAKSALAALPFAAFANPDSVINGVTIGLQGYSFRDLNLEQAIQGMAKLKLSCCELYQQHIEPRKLPREELRKWRLTVPLDEIRAAGKKVRDAGIAIWSYGYNIKRDFTDEEIARGLEIARTLGTTRINCSTNVSLVERIDKYASQARIYVGLHNHSRVVPNEFATPDDYARALRGRSAYMRITFDVGHFVAAGFEPIAFMEEHAPLIQAVHLKDRKKDQGEAVPFGQGATPIREVLQLMKRKKYRFPALIEYEYKGGDPVQEVGRCLDYCRRALA
jgi:sugar phosphate isomerase/epimerase